MIYLLIVVYNHKIQLKKINNDISTNFSWIIFDNSTNKNIHDINRCFCEKKGIIYCTFDKNVGLPKAYNYVINNFLKEKDYLVIVDEDTEISDDYFRIVDERVRNNDSMSHLAVFKYGKHRYGPKIINNISKYKVVALKERVDLNGYLLGINSCSLYASKLFKNVGLFDERLFLDYVDVDFCMRLAINEIKSKTINANLKQHFFAKEKATFGNAKFRFSILKHDAKVFYSNKYIRNYFRRKFLYIRDMFKFIMLCSLSNNIFWLIPLLFVKAKGEK